MHNAEHSAHPTVYISQNVHNSHHTTTHNMKTSHNCTLPTSAISHVPSCSSCIAVPLLSIHILQRLCTKGTVQNAQCTMHKQHLIHAPPTMCTPPKNTICTTFHMPSCSSCSCTSLSIHNIHGCKPTSENKPPSQLDCIQQQRSREHKKIASEKVGHPMIGIHTGNFASKLLRITFLLNLTASNINASENTMGKH